MNKIREIKKSLRLVTVLLIVAAGTSYFTGVGLDSSDLGASPAGVRADYEILVTLKSDATDSFEYRQELSRSEYNDVRFSPRKAREKAIRAAKAGYTKKMGYFRKLYGEETDRLSSMQVLDVLLVDNRSRRQESLLRRSS